VISRRHIAALLTTVALTAPAWGPLTTPAAAQDTSAVAVNKHDDSSVFRLAFSIHRVLGDVVDQQNAAVAYASCDTCQTVAISIQVLIVVSDPSVVDPLNLALAVNQNCSLCETLASAYQFVLGGAAIRLQLTGQGRQELQRIHHELLRLRNSGLSIEEIQAQTDTLMDQLRQVLATQLVVLGPPGGGKSQTPAQAPGATATTTQPEQSPSETTPGATTPSATTPTQTEPTQTTSGSGSDQTNSGSDQTNSGSGSDQTPTNGASTP
jgi:putative peptide zinc metalloprotease protein